MPEIKEYPPVRVAYVTEKGSADDAMPRGFARLFAWMREKGIHPMGRSVAIFYDDPAKVPPADQRCDTCVPVDPNVQVSNGVGIKMIGGCQVAAHVYKGRGDRDQAYRDLYDWLHAEGYHESDVPFETYLSQLGEEMRAEIAVPIEKVTASKGKTTTKRARGTTMEKGTSRKRKSP